MGSKKVPKLLSEETEKRMREERLAGMEYRELARKYNVSLTLAWRAVQRAGGRHVY